MRWLLFVAAVAGCASEPQRPEALLTRQPASDVVLHCTPSDAEVWLDGVPQGRCDDFAGKPKALKLGKGLRKIEVRKEGFGPYQSYIESDGTRAVLTVALPGSGGS